MVSASAAWEAMGVWGCMSTGLGGVCVTCGRISAVGNGATIAGEDGAFGGGSLTKRAMTLGICVAATFGQLCLGGNPKGGWDCKVSKMDCDSKGLTSVNGRTMTLGLSGSGSQIWREGMVSLGSGIGGETFALDFIFGGFFIGGVQGAEEPGHCAGLVFAGGSVAPTASNKRRLSKG